MVWKSFIACSPSNVWCACFALNGRSICFLRMVLCQHTFSSHDLNYVCVPETLLMQWKVSLSVTEKIPKGQGWLKSCNNCLLSSKHMVCWFRTIRRGEYMLVPHSPEPAYLVIALSECTYEHLRLYWYDETSYFLELVQFQGSWDCIRWVSSTYRYIQKVLQSMLTQLYTKTAYALPVQRGTSIP